MQNVKNEDLRQRFISAMGHAANTVSVVTTDGAAGRAGVTVSAMSSVSADTQNPTILICVNHLSQAASKILSNEVICVNILRDDQAHISDTFAGRFKDKTSEKFSCCDWTEMVTGAPRVVDPLVAFDCKVVSRERVGAHYVIFGEVLDIFISSVGSPLIYSNRAYGTATPFKPGLAFSASTSLERSELSLACFSTLGPYIMPEIIERIASSGDWVDFNLVEGDHRRITESLMSGEAELALLYDLFLPDGLDTVPLTELAPYVLVAKSHRLSDKASIKPVDLVDYPLVLMTLRPSPDYFLGILEKHGVVPSVIFKSENLEMVRGLVGRGLGYTLLTTKPATTMTYDGRALVTRPLIADVPLNRVVLAARKGRELSKAAKSFVLHCRQLFDVSSEAGFWKD